MHHGAAARDCSPAEIARSSLTARSLKSPPLRPEILFPLFAPVTSLKGVGQRYGKLVEKAAGPLIVDLVWHRPVGLIDRSAAPAVAAALPGQIATLTVTVEAHYPPSRPSLLFIATPERSPWVTFDDVRAKGAIVVWPTTDTAGTPPEEIKQRFPGIAPEVPRVFERPLQGTLPLLRIGWAVIRPQAEPIVVPSAAQAP